MYFDTAGWFLHLVLVETIVLSTAYFQAG